MAVTNTVTGKMNYLTVGSNTYEIEDKNAAPLASPAFTGTPTAPTATAGTSTTQIATTEFVMDAMSGAGAGTVTSVGLSNATNGGLSISGSPVTSSGTITVGHSNILTSAQTTQAVYPIKIDKNGHISAYGSAVTIPSKTSELTNDSGFITSDSDEKVALAEVTSSTAYYPIVGTGTTAKTRQYDTTGLKYVGITGTTNTVGTSTLTLGNSTAAGTAGNKFGQIDFYGASQYKITLKPATDLSTWPTANRTISLPDQSGKIALTTDLPSITLNGTSTTSPSFYAPASAGTNGYVLKSNGSGAPTWTSAALTDINVQTNVGTSGNTYYLIGTSATSLPTTGVTYSSNTKVKIGTDTTTLQVGAANFPGQIGLSVTSGGEGFYTIIKSAATAGTTITLPNATGTVALTSNIPTITLNGSSTTSPSFYAPTTAGTDGYYLKSNGSGAPTWAAISAGGVTDVTVAGTSVVTSGVAAIAAPVQIIRW